MRHLKDLKSGDYVKVQLFSRKPLLYKHLSENFYDLGPGEATRRTRTWASSVVAGGVITNDPEAGVLHVGVTNQQTADKVFKAAIPYSYISMLHVATVDIQLVDTPAFLKDIPLPPRIKFVRVVL